MGGICRWHHIWKPSRLFVRVIEHWRRNHCKHQQTLQVSLKSAAAHEWSAALFHTQKLQRAFHHFLLRETTIARHGNRLAVEFVSNWLTKSKSAKGCPACDPHLGRDYPQPVCKQEKIVIESDRGEKFSGKVSKTCENVVSLGRGKLVGTFALWDLWVSVCTQPTHRVLEPTFFGDAPILNWFSSFSSQHECCDRMNENMWFVDSWSIPLVYVHASEKGISGNFGMNANWIQVLHSWLWPLPEEFEWDWHGTGHCSVFHFFAFVEFLFGEVIARAQQVQPMRKCSVLSVCVRVPCIGVLWMFMTVQSGTSVSRKNGWNKLETNWMKHDETWWNRFKFG